jgi:dTMP kinase
VIHRPGVLICLSGIDGSGKTTLAKALIRYMNEHGTSGHYVWGGFSPTILLQPVLSFAKHLFYQEECHTTVLPGKGRVLRSNLWATIYHHMVLADYILQMRTRVGFPLFLGRNVVCDRYVYDTVVNTALVLDYSDNKLLRLLRIMQRLVPRPSWVFVTDLPEDAAYARKDDILSIAFLAERRQRFHLIAATLDLPILDTCQSPKAIVEHIAAQVMETRRGR